MNTQANAAQASTTITIPRPIVIEWNEEVGEERWGVSLGGPNPEEKDYIPMPNRDAAFRLRDTLLSYTVPAQIETSRQTDDALEATP